MCVCRKGVAYVSSSGFVDGLVYITFVEDRRTLAVGDTFSLSRALVKPTVTTGRSNLRIM